MVPERREITAPDRLGRLGDLRFRRRSAQTARRFLGGESFPRRFIYCIFQGPRNMADWRRWRESQENPVQRKRSVLGSSLVTDGRAPGLSKITRKKRSWRQH